MAANGDVVEVGEDSRLSVIDAVLHFVGAHVVRRIHVRHIELAGVVPGYRRGRAVQERARGTRGKMRMYRVICGGSWSRSRPKSALSFSSILRMSGPASPRFESSSHAPVAVAIGV